VWGPLMVLWRASLPGPLEKQARCQAVLQSPRDHMLLVHRGCPWDSFWRGDQPWPLDASAGHDRQLCFTTPGVRTGSCAYLIRGVVLHFGQADCSWSCSAVPDSRGRAANSGGGILLF